MSVEDASSHSSASGTDTSPNELFDSPPSSPSVTLRTDATSIHSHYFGRTVTASTSASPTAPIATHSQQSRTEFFKKLLPWTSRKVAEPELPKERTLEGVNIALAGVEFASSAYLVQQLSDADLALTSLPQLASESAQDPKAYKHKQEKIEAQLYGHLNTFCNEQSIVHPSSSNIELRHMAELLGGLDALVVNLGAFEEDKNSYRDTICTIDPLVTSLVAPKHPELWKDKSSKLAGTPDSPCTCTCGQERQEALEGKVNEFGKSAHFRSGSAQSHDARSIGSSSVRTSGRSSTLPTPSSSSSTSSSFFGRLRTKSTPAPPPSDLVKAQVTREIASINVPFARVVVIADTRTDSRDILYYLSGLRALSRERILAQILPPRPRKPRRERSPRRQYTLPETVSKPKERSQTYIAPTSHHEHPRWANRSTSNPHADEEVVPRLVKTFLIDQELVGEFLVHILLGRFDTFDTFQYGIHFESSKIVLLRKHLEKQKEKEELKRRQTSQPSK